MQEAYFGYLDILDLSAITQVFLLFSLNQLLSHQSPLQVSADRYSQSHVSFLAGLGEWVCRPLDVRGFMSYRVILLIREWSIIVGNFTDFCDDKGLKLSAE